MRTQVTPMVSNHGKLLTKWHVSISKHHVNAWFMYVWVCFFVCKTIIEYVGIFIPFENSCILSSIYDILGQIARHVVVVPWRHSLHKPFSERYLFSPHWQRSDCFKSLAVTNNAAGYLAFLRSNMPQIHLLAALAEILQETTVVSREVQTPWNEKVSYGERLSNKMIQASGKTLFSVSVTRQEYSCAKLRICRHKDSHWRRYSTQGCEPWAGTERSERSVDVEWNACKAALLKNLQGQILATHESCNRCRRALLSHEPRCKFLAIVFGVGFSCLHHQARSTLWKAKGGVANRSPHPFAPQLGLRR